MGAVKNLVIGLIEDTVDEAADSLYVVDMWDSEKEEVKNNLEEFLTENPDILSVLYDKKGNPVDDYYVYLNYILYYFMPAEHARDILESFGCQVMSAMDGRLPAWNIHDVFSEYRELLSDYKIGNDYD